MAGAVTSTKFKGVRIREHHSRKFRGRPDQYFLVRYRVDGKLREESLGWASEGWTEEKAALELAKLKQAHVTGEGHRTLHERREARRRTEEAKKLAGYTFAEAALEFGRWAVRNKKTWPGDESRLRNYILPLLGDKPLVQIGQADIERLKVACQEKSLSPATTNHILQTARRVIGHAGDLGFFHGENPCRRVKLIRHDNRRIRFLSHQEAETLLAAILPRSQTLHDMALLSLFTGLRYGEIASLKWKDVDLVHGELTILDPKNGRTRHAPFGARVKDMLVRRQAESDSNILAFPDRYGQRRQRPSLLFKQIADELFNQNTTDPRQKVVFHSLRHSFASWLALQGTPIFEIKELLGHQTLEMAMRYAHLCPDTKRRAVALLDQTTAAGGRW